MLTVEPITITSQDLTYRVERTTLVAKQVGGVAGNPADESPEPDEDQRRRAAQILELLTALDPENRWRKAPPIKVFNLRYLKGFKAGEIARVCHCSKALVHSRLAAIRGKLSWRPKQLREVSSHVEAMAKDVTAWQAKSIYRKGAAYGDEHGGG